MDKESWKFSLYCAQTHQRSPCITALLIVSHLWYFTPAGKCRHRPSSQQLSQGMIDICGYFTRSLHPKAWLHCEPLRLLLSPTRVAIILHRWLFWHTLNALRKDRFIAHLSARVPEQIFGDTLHARTYMCCTWPSWHTHRRTSLPS